ncbi:hypothetical protein OH77DRAFT_1490959, partial [Trametes cingulata]
MAAAVGLLIIWRMRWRGPAEGAREVGGRTSERGVRVRAQPRRPGAERSGGDVETCSVPSGSHVLLCLSLSSTVARRGKPISDDLRWAIIRMSEEEGLDLRASAPGKSCVSWLSGGALALSDVNWMHQSNSGVANGTFQRMMF